MTRIMKYMKGYSKLVALIVVLLVVQAFCDLSLPQYTSDIIDTGIQNKGVTHVLPEKVLAQEFENAQVLMTDKEKKDWKDSYRKDGKCYQRKELSQKRLEKLDDEFADLQCTDGFDAKGAGSVPDGRGNDRGKTSGNVSAVWFEISCNS